jgi:hypothetical protein
MDDRCFRFNSESGRVITEKGTKLFAMSYLKRKESIIVVDICSVEGRFLPTLVVLKGTSGKEN